MSKQWIIKNTSNRIMMDKGKVLFFGSQGEALRYIENKCGDSPYLKVYLWRGCTGNKGKKNKTIKG